MRPRGGRESYGAAGDPQRTVRSGTLRYRPCPRSEEKMPVGRIATILALAFLPWRFGNAAFEEDRTFGPVLRAGVVQHAWIYPDRVLNSDGQDCGALDAPATFGSYMGCRHELKEGFGTSIVVSKEMIGAGIDSFSRTDFAVTFPEAKLRAGKWTLPAVGLRLVYSNCERSWLPVGGCFVSSRASGTLEVREIGDGDATVVLDAIFLPDRAGLDLIPPDEKAERDERSRPAPESFAFTVRARAAQALSAD